MWPITLLIVLLWPIFYPQGDKVLLQVWRVRITTQGILQGLSTALRVDALAFAFLVLLFSTDQARLVRGLVKLGLPYEWGLTLAIALRYLPTLYGMYTTVSEAQQARGWVVGEGSFIQRIKSYLPILVAVIVTALRLADNLSMALAARGFQPGARRTYLRELKLGPADKVCLPLLALSLILSLILRFAW
jgi:energy-coupling factor transport system permease protein